MRRTVSPPPVAARRRKRPRGYVPRMSETRTEHDTLGPGEGPVWARWGAQTQRAVENFPISDLRISRELIAALASIKGCAATVNAELGILPTDVAEAVHDAAAEVANGAYDDHFPIDVFQTG